MQICIILVTFSLPELQHNIKQMWYASFALTEQTLVDWHCLVWYWKTGKWNSQMLSTNHFSLVHGESLDPHSVHP